MSSIRCDFTPEEYNLVKQAANLDDRPMKKFCERAIIAEVSRVLKTPPAPKDESRDCST